MQTAKGRIDVPMLLIDDEADNAVDQYQEGSARGRLRSTKLSGELLALFRRSSYVGF